MESCTRHHICTWILIFFQSYLKKKGSAYSYGTRTPTFICYSYESLLRMIITSSNPNLERQSHAVMAKVNRFKICA